MATYRALVVTNLWPTESDPGYGSFVQAQMESLRPFGVEFDVLFIDGRRSHWNYLRGVREMRRRLRSGHYDLIHAHFGLSGWVARYQFRVPVIVSFMGDDVLGRWNRDGQVTLMGHIFRLSSFILARLVRAVIVKSCEMKSRLRLTSAYVIPNGIDLDLFRPMNPIEARRQLGLDLDKKFVLFPFDRTIENKRYDLVQASVTRARAEIQELEILQVSGRPRALMPLFFNAADVLVLASLTEGSPNAVKEAMAVNLPVVAVRVGDAAELMEGSEGHHLVARDPEEMARKIVEVCRRGTRARSRQSLTRVSMERVAQEIIDVYAAALRH